MIPHRLVFFASPAKPRENIDQPQATNDHAEDFTEAERAERAEMELRLTGELADMPEGAAWDADELKQLTWDRATKTGELEDMLTTIRTFKTQMRAFEAQLARAIAAQPDAHRWTYDATFQTYAWAKERTWAERQDMLRQAGSDAEIGWEAIAASETAATVEKNLKSFPPTTQAKFTELKKTFDGRKDLPKEASDRAVRDFAECVTKRATDLPGLKAAAVEHARFASNKEMPLIAEGVSFTIKNRTGSNETWTGWIDAKNFHTLSLPKRREWLGKLKDAIRRSSADIAALQKMKAETLKKKPQLPEKWTKWMAEMETFERAARAAGRTPGVEQTLGYAIEHLESKRAELQPTLVTFTQLDARGGQYATPEARQLVAEECARRDVKSLPRSDFEALTPKEREAHLAQIEAAYDAVDVTLTEKAAEAAAAEAAELAEREAVELDAATLERQADELATEMVRGELKGLDLADAISKEAKRRTESSKAFTELAGARDAARQGGALANIKKWATGGEAASAGNENSSEQVDAGAAAEIADVTDDARLTAEDELRRDVAGDVLKKDEKKLKAVRQLLGIGDNDTVDAATEQRIAYLVATADDSKKFSALLRADNDTKKLFDHHRADALARLKNQRKDVKLPTPDEMSEAA